MTHDRTGGEHDRRRRRGHVPARRGDARGGRGPIRGLPGEDDGLGRQERFEARLEAVTATEARRRRLQRWTGGAVAGLALGVLGAAGLALAGAVGLVVGLLLGIAAVGAVRAARVLARRRGAQAWDWQARRYRLLGNPSAEVQARDRPATDRPRDG